MGILRKSGVLPRAIGALMKVYTFCSIMQFASYFEMRTNGIPPRDPTAPHYNGPRKYESKYCMKYVCTLKKNLK